MAVFIRVIFVVLIAPFVLGHSDVPEMILNVHTTCAVDINGTAEVSVISDSVLTITIECKNDNTFNISRIGTSEYYNITVAYTGDWDSTCVFKKKLNSEVYEADVEIAYSDGVERVLDIYRVICTFDEYMTDVLAVKEISDSLIPPNQLEAHLGHATSSTFSIEVHDIHGRPMSGEMSYGKKIRLIITMSPAGGNTTEESFKVLHCDCLGVGSVSYSFLRSGCGDGIIIGKKKGFTTHGLVAESPFFKSFKLFGSSTVSFQCTFNTCTNQCDGESCAYSYIRRRRKSDEQNLGDTKKILDIQNEEHTIRTKPLRISTQRFKEDLKLPVPKLDGVAKTKMSKGQPVTMLHGVAKTKISKGQPVTMLHGVATTRNTKGQPVTMLHGVATTRNTKGQRVPMPDDVDKTKITKEIIDTPVDSNKVSKPDKMTKLNNLSSASVLTLLKPAKTTLVSITSKPKPSKFKGKSSTKLSYDQIGVLVGCSLFLIMVGLFVSITLWHIRQKNKVETQYRANRIKDLDSRTYLLEEENT